MNPRGAVLGLAIATAVGISLIAVAIDPLWAVGLAFTGTALSLLLNHSYARSLSGMPRPMARVPLDHLVAAEIGGAFLIPLVAVLFAESHLMTPIYLDAYSTVVLIGVTAAIEICFVSSLVDWYYVLPRRDGLVGLPPCQAPAEERWQGVTWLWFLHRFVAAIAVMASAYLVALALGFWLVDRYPDALAAAGGIPVILFVISYFRREYLRDIGKVWSLLFSPMVALGEHISIWRDGRILGGFVFNVSIDRIDLLSHEDGMSHIPIGDIDAHIERSNKQALCASGCVRGVANGARRAPVGGHGSCLVDTPEDHLELRRRGKRLLIL